MYLSGFHFYLKAIVDIGKIAILFMSVCFYPQCSHLCDHFYCYYCSTNLWKQSQFLDFFSYFAQLTYLYRKK